MTDPLPIAAAATGLRIALRVTPHAARDSIERIETRPGKGPQLRLRVRALPDKGKANAAVLALLAKAWALPRAALSIVSGETARDKILLVEGDPAVLTLQLTSWFEGHCR